MKLQRRIISDYNSQKYIQIVTDILYDTVIENNVADRLGSITKQIANYYSVAENDLKAQIFWYKFVPMMESLRENKTSS